jgi:hypothetical protein
MDACPDGLSGWLEFALSLNNIEHHSKVSYTAKESVEFGIKNLNPIF